MWAMKGKRSWPGEEECIHLAGSFLCIHLGSARSASCSDQAFITLQAARTQLAQYGRENRAPSPVDTSENERKHILASTMLKDRAGGSWVTAQQPQTPRCNAFTGCPSASSPRKVTPPLHLGSTILTKPPAALSTAKRWKLPADTLHPTDTYGSVAPTSAKPTMNLHHWPRNEPKEEPLFTPP